MKDVMYLGASSSLNFYVHKIAEKLWLKNTANLKKGLNIRCFMRIFHADLYPPTGTSISKLFRGVSR